MTVVALWIIVVTAIAGCGLSCFYLMEKPILGRARLASWAHGLAGSVGTTVLVAAVWNAAADPAGFGRLSVYIFAATLLLGFYVFATQMRRRRASGLVIALHATLGIAGLTILVAYVSIPH